jgi:hypothetical protein
MSRMQSRPVLTARLQAAPAANGVSWTYRRHVAASCSFRPSAAACIRHPEQQQHQQHPQQHASRTLPPPSLPAQRRGRQHQQRGSRAAPRAAADASVQTATPRPDFELKLPEGGVVSVFGVEHMERQPHIGEWVLQTKPAAVVVETACHPEHGAWPGNLFSCSDQQILGSGGSFFQRVFCQVAAAMAEEGDASRAPGGAWAQACANFNGEQLAYVAALATGAQLAFGDRPKDVTYR